MISVERSTLSTKLPWLQFYTSDWRNDPKLSMCKPSTRGIWIDALSAMHDDGRSGTLSGTLCQLTRVLRCSESELHDALDDLTATGAADVERRNGIVTLVNRRMSREAKERADNKIRQQRHREGKTGHDDGNGSVTPPSRLSVSDSSSPLSEKKKGSGGKEKPPPAPSTDLFHSFWIEYPRHENPRKAREAFDRAGITPELLDPIIDWLAEARKSEQWQDKTKIPHPTTFLNQRRWEGDPPPPPAAKAHARDTVGLAETYRPPERDVCPNCEGTGRVLVVTGAAGIVARAPWSETRQAGLAGPGERCRVYRCACRIGRQHMHLDPEPAQDIEAIA
jgi:hypothetical protein